jgi:hypothetical protein
MYLNNIAWGLIKRRIASHDDAYMSIAIKRRGDSLQRPFCQQIIVAHEHTVLARGFCEQFSNIPIVSQIKFVFMVLNQLRVLGLVAFDNVMNLDTTRRIIFTNDDIIIAAFLTYD